MINSKKLIVFATHLEARHFLLNYGVDDFSREFYQTQSVDILISGMGSVQSGIRVARYLKPEHQLIINVGIAGSLKPDLINGIHSVKKIGKFMVIPNTSNKGHVERLARISYPELAIEEKEGKSIICFDFPLHCSKIRNRLAEENWDLVDMESYGIASAARSHNIPIQIVKLVSDFAAEDTKERIHKKMDHFSNLLAEHLKENL